FEPSSPFATHIAKYFQNSLREDGLVTICGDGVIYTEGKAGTLQEIFQDTPQNYYRSILKRSIPRFFRGRKLGEEALPVLPLLKSLFQGVNSSASFENCVLVTDSPE